MDMHFSEELVLNILIRLPVKALLRFRCVCKTWCSLISNSDFIYSHLHHNQVAENYNALIRKYNVNYQHNYLSLHSDNEEFNQIQTLDFPADYFVFVGSANGLICLWDEENICKKYHAVILWNPSINKLITLPELRLSQSIERFFKSSSCFGFGYDLSSNDFKVVMFITYRSVVHPLFPDQNSTAVFSLARKSWKTLDHSAPMVLFSEPCNVGGFLYHLVLISFHERKIVSFDLRAEVFLDIACPVDVESGRLLDSGLTQFHDSLAQFNQLACDSGNRYNIWVMGDDGAAKSWTKIFSVMHPAGGAINYCIGGISKKGLLVVIEDGSIFVSSDLEDGRVVHYVPPGIQTFNEIEKIYNQWHVDSYQESLILLKEGDNLPLSPPSSGSGMYVGSSDNPGEHCEIQYVDFLYWHQF